MKADISNSCGALLTAGSVAVGLIIFLSACTSSLIGEEKKEIPFPEALDRAGVVQSRITDIQTQAIAVATNGDLKAVSLVTSFDTEGNVLESALQFASETLDAKLKTLIADHESSWEVCRSPSTQALSTTIPSGTVHRRWITTLNRRSGPCFYAIMLI